MTTFEKITSLITDTVDLQDDELELKLQGVILAAGTAQQCAGIVDTVKGDEDPTEQLEGLVDLAGVTGKANLNADDLAVLKNSIARIVKNPQNPALESALEGTFFAVLDLHTCCKELNEYISQMGSNEGEDEQGV